MTETKEVLLDLMSYCNSRVRRSKELLDRWKLSTTVEQHQVDREMDYYKRWKRNRDALVKVIEGME